MCICPVDKGKVDIPTTTNGMKSESSSGAPTSTTMTSSTPSEDSFQAVSQPALGVYVKIA